MARATSSLIRHERGMKCRTKPVILILIALSGIVTLITIFRNPKPWSHKTASSKPATSVASLVISVVQPEIPIIPPEIPIVQPDIPVVQPEIPITPPTIPVVQPEIPITPPEIPVVQPEIPITPPEIPVVQPKIPITSPEIPVTSSLPRVTPLVSTNLSCRQPDLDVHDPAIAKFFTPTKAIECDSRNDWVCTDGGMAFVCGDVLKSNPETRCKYTFLKRKSEFVTVEDETVDGGNFRTQLKSDFFKVKCSNDKQSQWSNMMAGIRPDTSALARSSWDKLPPNALKLNVLVWGFDSLSRNTFIRKLPKTYSYLTDQLGAIVLKGYNIVGDGTPQAIIPILTGKTELELPDTRQRIPFTHYVNVYPFVWKEYEKRGYVTAHAEDSPEIGTFTYRLRGFDQQPTTHYMRPFYVAADNGGYTSPCMGGIPRHKVMMNWVRQFFTVYAEKPKFMFAFHSELSHSDYNKVGAADDDFLDMIRNLHDKDQLNNTLLIVMSDHGHRFAAIREFEQGKQEERLPFFSFTFPSWFEKQYPRAMANFRTNAGRLSTPFDIYPTLRDVLDLKDDGVGNIENRSISLFTEIPANRTCQAAHIEPHWCTCLDWKPLRTNDVGVINAAKTLVNFFNRLTQPHRKLCEELSLDKIVWAGWLLPTDDLLKFKENTDMDGFVPDLSGTTTTKVHLYQIKIHTTPGNGHFEASLKFDVKTQTFSVKEQDISRINKYGQAADCIEGREEQLRKYCYCKTSDHTENLMQKSNYNVAGRGEI